MDYSTIIAVIIAVVAIYLFVKLVLSPLMKALLGVIIFAAILYIAQNFFNLNFTALLAPLNRFFSGWGIFNPVSIVSKIGEYISSILNNIPK